MTHHVYGDIEDPIRDLTKNQYITLMLEDELVEMRDNGMFTLNRNGLAIADRDGEPSPLIRIGTSAAVGMVLRLAAEWDLVHS